MKTLFWETEENTWKKNNIIHTYPDDKFIFWLSILACVFIVKIIIMTFSEDWDVGIFYLSTKFELDRSSNNGDLQSDRDHLKHTQTGRQTDKQAGRQRPNMIHSPIFY